MLQEVDAGKEAARIGYKWRDKIEAAIKVTFFSLLVIFGIFAFIHEYPDESSRILFNIWMDILLITILLLGLGLFAINAISPRSSKPDGEKTAVIDLRETFTHIIALIITVPLIIVTTYILYLEGDHSGDLTFISGLLGVIIGFYFGHRAVARVENQVDLEKEEKRDAMEEMKEAIREREEALREKEEALRESREAEQVLKDQTGIQKQEIWYNFKENAKEKYQDKLDQLKNIDQYLPWETPEGVLWTDLERALIAQFEAYWRGLSGE